MYTLRKRILVVDDDPEILETVSLYLSDIAEVTTACSGQQALLYIRQQPVDVIILDIEMPIMDGFKTLEQLRNLKECINVPVIMLTGRNDRYSVVNSFAMGIEGYLLKPVNKDELIDKITKICQKGLQDETRKTILAIDDDMIFLKQINSFLHTYYNVVMINSAKLALEYLSNHTPDLILLDYQMPLYNGVTMLNIIKKNSNCQNIPFIILSGTLDRDALLKFYPLGPVAYLTKPVGKEALLGKIMSALSQKQEESE